MLLFKLRKNVNNSGSSLSQLSKRDVARIDLRYDFERCSYSLLPQSQQTTNQATSRRQLQLQDPRTGGPPRLRKGETYNVGEALFTEGYK